MTPMFRGGEIVSLASVTQAGVDQFASHMASWLFNNTDDASGKINYKYFPSRNSDSNSNNMIRQFMANIALNRWANSKNDEELKEIAARALAYNLSSFYKKTDEIGVIEFRNKRKLGAAALAALAIFESQYRKSFESEEQALQNALLKQWDENGKFRTFISSNRDDNHNFYPGETLYYWSFLLKEKLDTKLLSKFMKSFEFYRAWHLENRNPAFIPWHTQAYYNVWTLTKNKELADFIFVMNDWLIKEMQRPKSKERYQDTFGRFFKPGSKFGPPHASSTGVYLEGLSDALLLAKALKDHKRERMYVRAIKRGLRSAMQLQFKNHIDSYYISNKKKVMGGLKTTVYDNVIRVDNIQHTLLGTMKILTQGML